MRYLYLHGFASGSGSTKGRFFADRFEKIGLSLARLDLNDRRGCPAHLHQQLAAVSAAAGGDRVVLLGSSLGAYVAAVFAARQPGTVDRMVLLAPAFAFARRWVDRMGPEAVEKWKSEGLEVEQHAFQRTVRIPYSFLAEALALPEMPDVRSPTLILHGRRDDVVDPELSRAFARDRPHVTCVILDSDHQLLDVTQELWERTRAFLDLSSPDSI